MGGHCLSTSIQAPAPSMSTPRGHLLAQVVEQHDVSVHIIQVVTVRGVLLVRPLVGVRALVGEHVIVVFGLIVNAVETCDLETQNF